MKALEPPESLYAQAAKKFLESGNRVAAQNELDQVAAGLRSHPDFLEIQWSIEAQGKKWHACLEISQSLITMAPERPTGWIKRSFVLHRIRRTQEALDQLFPAAEKFPEIAIIPFNLACYAARLECLWEAERWLKQAIEVGGGDFRKLALREKDLKSIWEKIAALRGKPERDVPPPGFNV